jgi:hypothetical protein
VTGPAWTDPKYMTGIQQHQLHALEAMIVARENERAVRRLQALMPCDPHLPVREFGTEVML